MNPAIKRMLLFTAGVVDIVGEKIKHLGESIKTEGALDPQEGRKVVSEVMQGATKKAEEVRTQVAQGAQVATQHVQRAADSAREAVHNATKPAPMPASTTTQTTESVANVQPAPMPVTEPAPVAESVAAEQPVMNSAEQLPSDNQPA